MIAAAGTAASIVVRGQYERAERRHVCIERGSHRGQGNGGTGAGQCEG